MNCLMSTGIDKVPELRNPHVICLTFAAAPNAQSFVSMRVRVFTVLAFIANAASTASRDPARGVIQ
jgi:hypothetical protein